MSIATCHCIRLKLKISLTELSTTSRKWPKCLQWSLNLNLKATLAVRQWRQKHEELKIRIHFKQLVCTFIIAPCCCWCITRSSGTVIVLNIIVVVFCYIILCDGWTKQHYWLAIRSYLFVTVVLIESWSMLSFYLNHINWWTQFTYVVALS